LEELSKSRRIPEELMDLALELDKVYIPARYPNAHPSGSPRKRYTKNEAQRIVEYAARIVNFCKGLLSEF
jgi:HEPN domain-containing protein